MVVNGYGFGECWRHLRAEALYGLVLTRPVSIGVESTERGDAMFGAMAVRAASHVLKLETFSALEQVTT
tara:strand:+ start:1036 stop:1242 length:207 start_codon:yes stop_codon:yes gene_type:complete